MPRKQKQYHFIYKTTNLINNKFYVGMHSTDNLEDGYFGSGKIINYSVNKHGIENHRVEILEFLPSREELKKREAEVVNEEMLKHPLCMNLKFGGEGGWDHINSNVIERNKSQILRSSAGGLAAAKVFEKGSTAAKNRSKMTNTSTLANNGKYNLPSRDGKPHSEETKQKMRKSKNNGESNSQFGSRWIHNLELKISKKIKKAAPLPIGWKEGRKLKFTNS